MSVLLLGSWVQVRRGHGFRENMCRLKVAKAPNPSRTPKPKPRGEADPEQDPGTQTQPNLKQCRVLNKESFWSVCHSPAFVSRLS